MEWEAAGLVRLPCPVPTCCWKRLFQVRQHPACLMWTCFLGQYVKRLRSTYHGNAHAEKSFNGEVRKRPVSSAKIKRDLHIEMKRHREAEKVPRTGSRPNFLRSICIWTFFQSFLNLLFFAVHLNLALFCPPGPFGELRLEEEGRGESGRETCPRRHNHTTQPTQPRAQPTHTLQKTTQPRTSYTTHITTNILHNPH